MFQQIIIPIRRIQYSHTYSLIVHYADIHPGCIIISASESSSPFAPIENALLMMTGYLTDTVLYQLCSEELHYEFLNHCFRKEHEEMIKR